MNELRLTGKLLGGKGKAEMLKAETLRWDHETTDYRTKGEKLKR